MVRYYRLELDCDIYIKIENDVRITVPAYNIKEREPINFIVSEKTIKFIYYKYLIELKCQEECAKIHDLESNKVSEAFLHECRENEYIRIVNLQGYMELLEEPYEKNYKDDIEFSYDGRVSFRFFDVDTDDEIERISHYVRMICKNIKHAPKDEFKEGIKADDLYHMVINRDAKINCRNLAVIMNAVFLRHGIKARYVVCLQKEKTQDCHFMLEVYSAKRGCWIAVDSSYALLFTDQYGEYISLRQMREKIVKRENIVVVPLVDMINEQLYWNNMIRKMYAFRRCVFSTDSFNQRNLMVELLPNIEHVASPYKNILYIDNPDLFWNK